MTTQLSWTIGDIEITAIQEILDAGKLIQSIIPNATKRNIQKLDWLVPNFADSDGNLKAVVQSFLITSSDQTILVDTCNGNDKERLDMPIWGGLDTSFLERLEQAGTKPENVDIVINTHMHFDHIGWNTKLEEGKWIPTFPNAQYLFVKDEYKYWSNDPQNEMYVKLGGTI